MPDTAQAAVSIELSRRFDAPPERVFDAWVSKSWCEWMGPAGTRCEVVELEPRLVAAFTCVAPCRTGGWSTSQADIGKWSDRSGL
jgi:uncharacterized protein YndB with AHSA1/START domain